MTDPDPNDSPVGWVSVNQVRDYLTARNVNPPTGADTDTAIALAISIAGNWLYDLSAHAVTLPTRATHVLPAEAANPYPGWQRGYRRGLDGSTIGMGDQFSVGPTGVFNAGLQAQRVTKGLGREIPGTPVLAVDEVRTDADQLIDPATYRVVANRLQFQSDDPNGQALGDITITYRYGNPPDVNAQQACSVLSGELALAMNDPSLCRLPSTVTGVARKGVSFTLRDAATLLRERRTGLPLVDAWIFQVNPDGRRNRPRIASPDFPQGRRSHL